MRAALVAVVCLNAYLVTTGIALTPGVRHGRECTKVSLSQHQLTIGVLLAIIGNLLNGIGISLQKGVHGNALDIDRLDYLWNKRWWLGFLLLATGEIGCAFALGFAPASVISPIGGVTVLTTTALAVCFHAERLTRSKNAGLVTVLLGVALVGLMAPEANEMLTASRTIALFAQPKAMTLVALLAAVALSCEARPLRDSGWCSLLQISVQSASMSSLTVIACRPVFSMILLTASDCREGLCGGGRCGETLGSPIFWFLSAIAVSTAVGANLIIDQRGIAIFGQVVWVPVHFTSCALLFSASGAIVFDEFSEFAPRRAPLYTLGVVHCLVGVVVLSRDTFNPVAPILLRLQGRAARFPARPGSAVVRKRRRPA